MIKAVFLIILGALSNNAFGSDEVVEACVADRETHAA